MDVLDRVALEFCLIVVGVVGLIESVLFWLRRRRKQQDRWWQAREYGRNNGH